MSELSEAAQFELDLEAASWLIRLYPDAVPNEGMTAWESCSDEVKYTLRGFVMGRRSATA